MLWAVTLAGAAIALSFAFLRTVMLGRGLAVIWHSVQVEAVIALTRQCMMQSDGDSWGRKV